MHFLCKSATIIDTQMHPGQALFIQKVQGYVTTSAGLGMQKCRGGSSTGAGLRRFPSLSVRSTRPVARSGVDNRGRPWTAGTAFGCTLAAHRLNPVDHPSTTWGGTPPQTPPRFAALRGLFQFFFSEIQF